MAPRLGGDAVEVSCEDLSMFMVEVYATTCAREALQDVTWMPMCVPRLCVVLCVLVCLWAAECVYS